MKEHLIIINKRNKAEVSNSSILSNTIKVALGLSIVGIVGFIMING